MTKTEFVIELFDMVGKVIDEPMNYKVNMQSGLAHEAALLALKKEL